MSSLKLRVFLLTKMDVSPSSIQRFTNGLTLQGSRADRHERSGGFALVVEEARAELCFCRVVPFGHGR